MFPVASQTVSYPVAQIDDPDGVKTSFATSASPVALDDSDYNGALVTLSGTVWLKTLPRTVTITRSSSAGSYSTDPIVLTGFVAGTETTENLTPEDADGGDVIRGVKLWDRPPSIAIPAQVNVSGAFTIGAGDIGAPAGGHFIAVALHAADDLNVQYGIGASDTIPVAAAEVGIPKYLGCARILTNPALTAPTAVGLTVYI